MEAYVKKSGYFFTVYEGRPEYHSKSAKVLGEYLTRRQALRHAKRNGHDIIIRGREPETPVGATGVMREAITRSEERKMNSFLDIMICSTDMVESGKTGQNDGEWLSLPMKTDEIEFALSRLGVADGEYGFDYHIIAFESSLPVISRLPLDHIRSKNIDELNELAEQLENYDPKLVLEINSMMEEVVEKHGGKKLFANSINPDARNGPVPTVFQPQWKEVRGMEQLSFDSAAPAMVASNVRSNVKPTGREYSGPYEKMKDTMSKLENGIKGVFDSGKYRHYLDTMAKFHKYSYANCMLIAMQKPEATFVAGFDQWNRNFERKVKPDEKGIKILAPTKYESMRDIERKDRDGSTVLYKDGTPVMDRVKVVVPGFKVVHVFDVSQTYGKPLHELETEKLTGRVEDYEDFTSALDRASPAPIAFGKLPEDVNGYYDNGAKCIVINEGMSQQQSLKTMIHEIAHARLHDIDSKADANMPKVDKETREVQAESIAYTVCQNFGIDTSQYSFSYIALWSGDKEMETLKASLGTIRKEANAIITDVENHIADLQKEQENALKQEVVALPQGKDEKSAVEAFPRMTKPELQEMLKDDMVRHGMVGKWAKDAMAANGYVFGDKKFPDIVKGPPDMQKPPLEPKAANSTAITKTAEKPAAKSAAKSAAKEKPSIKDQLAAAKVEAAERNAKTEKNKSKAAELG